MRQRENCLSCFCPWARHIPGCSTGTVHSISEPKVVLDDKHLLNSKKETRGTEIGSVLTISLSHSALPALPVTSSVCLLALSVDLTGDWCFFGFLLVRQTACRQPTSAYFTLLPLISWFFSLSFWQRHSILQKCFISSAPFLLSVSFGDTGKL